MVRVAGPHGPKAAGAGEAWAQAGSAEVDLAAVEVASVVVDLADGGNAGEILVTKHYEMQLWRKSYVVR